MTYNFPPNWKTNIKSLAELANCLQISENLLNKICRAPKDYYHRTTIIKKGKPRILTIPCGELKTIQKAIYSKLFQFDFPPEVHGGVINKSIITNATPHKQKKYVACVDINNFYPSINFERIKKILELLGYNTVLSGVLTSLTTYEFSLPQGTPTSPVLANLVLYNLDRRIATLCNTKKLSYTRFFDDISISGNNSLSSVLNKIESFIKAEGFIAHKQREMNSNTAQLITGLIVNGKKLKVAPETINQLNSTLDTLMRGQIPDIELDKVLKSAEGCVNFLKSVNRAQAITIGEKYKQVKKILENN